MVYRALDLIQNKDCSYTIMTLRWSARNLGEAGIANLISKSWGGVAEEAICMLWAESGCSQEKLGIIMQV